MTISRSTAIVAIAALLISCGPRKVEIAPPPREVVEPSCERALLVGCADEQALELDTPRTKVGAGAAGAAASAGKTLAYGGAASGAIMLKGAELTAVGGAGGAAAAGPLGVVAALPGLVVMAVGAVVLAGTIVVTPVAAVVGAVSGASEAPEAEEIEAANTALKTALDSLELDTILRRNIYQRLEQKKLPQPYDCGEIDDWIACGREAGDNVGYVVEIIVDEPHFGIDPTLDAGTVPFVSVTVIVHSLKDQNILHQRDYIFRGFPKNYFLLARNDAQIFRQDLSKAMAAISSTFVADFFEENNPQRLQSGSQPPNSVWTILPPS